MIPRIFQHMFLPYIHCSQVSLYIWIHTLRPKSSHNLTPHFPTRSALLSQLFFMPFHARCYYFHRNEMYWNFYELFCSEFFFFSLNFCAAVLVSKIQQMIESPLTGTPLFLSCAVSVISGIQAKDYPGIRGRKCGADIFLHTQHEFFEARCFCVGMIQRRGAEWILSFLNSIRCCPSFFATQPSRHCFNSWPHIIACSTSMNRWRVPLISCLKCTLKVMGKMSWWILREGWIVKGRRGMTWSR